MWCIYHVPGTLAIGIEIINKQTQQTNKQPQWVIKFKHSLEYIKAATFA